MTNFKFQGKTYRIVPDVLGELVAGCRKCAFDGNDELCSGVDQADVLNTIAQNRATFTITKK